MNVQTSTFAATVGGAISAIAVWVLQLTVKVDIPPAIASAITTLIMAVITQFVPDRPTSVAPAP